MNVSLQPYAFININKHIEFICNVNRCKDDRKRVWHASSVSPVLCFAWRAIWQTFLFIYLFLNSEAEKKVSENGVSPDLVGECLRCEFSWNHCNQFHSEMSNLGWKMRFHVVSKDRSDITGICIKTLIWRACADGNTCGFNTSPVL